MNWRQTLYGWAVLSLAVLIASLFALPALYLIMAWRDGLLIDANQVFVIAGQGMLMAIFEIVIALPLLFLICLAYPELIVRPAYSPGHCENCGYYVGRRPTSRHCTECGQPIPGL